MAGVNVRRKGTGSPERMRACWLYGKLGHPARLSLGRLMKSQGFHQSADAQSRLPAAGSWERKAPTSCRPFLGRTTAKPRFAAVRWYSFAASCRGVAVQMACFTESADILSWESVTKRLALLIRAPSPDSPAARPASLARAATRAPDR